MNSFVIAGLLFAVAAMFSWLLFRAGHNRFKVYRARSRFLAPPEQAVYAALTTAMGPEYRVFSQVRLADVLSVIDRVGERQLSFAYNRIALKSLDFLICDQAFRIIAAVQLTDRRNARPARERRDRFLRRISKDAHLPLIEISAHGKLDPQELRARILEEANIRTKDRPQVQQLPDSQHPSGEPTPSET